MISVSRGSAYAYELWEERIKAKAPLFSGALFQRSGKTLNVVAAPDFRKVKREAAHGATSLGH